METKNIRIELPAGLHLRTAAQLAKSASEFESRVLICKENVSADLKSVLELLILGAENGSRVQVIAVGSDAKEAIGRVTEILTDGAGI